MTIVEVQNQIMTSLVKRDTFSLAKDASTIKVSKDQADFKNTLIAEAFKIFESAKMVRKLEAGDDIVWVKEQKLDSYDQNVNISAYTAEAIANLINQYRTANGLDYAVADKMKVTEIDIQTVIIIANQLLNAIDKTTDNPNDSV